MHSASAVAAGGFRVILMAAIFYSFGTGLYIWARREQNLPVFNRWEGLLFDVPTGEVISR